MSTHEVVLGNGLAHRITRIVIYGALLFMAAIYVFPLLVVVLTSLKPLEELRSGTIIDFPAAPTMQPWYQAMFAACIGTSCNGLAPYFVNSVMMVVPAVLLSTPIGAVNGFALTHFKFPGHNWVFAFLLFGVFIPLQIVLIPLAYVMGSLGIANSVMGLILVHVIYGIAFTTLFFRNFFITVPHEIVDAARMDGARFLQIFRRIVLPVAIPTMVVSVIWQFTHIWNDYLLATTYTSGLTSPVTVGLYNMVASTTGTKEYNVNMAAVFLTALPTLLVYVFAGRYFLRGLVAGSVKG
ncbi:carbohydrate ABC transporter permease [Mesorhizobium sp. WSM3866]|uniref:carbohydrate ABC transporter permease n=1 Tax=unclassified Mesorhizobium TaxID=325217 RepID=UPI000801CC03|nr:MULTISPECIES: carbohydrate ABC transporter permease [unclassified Mesorhizobium]OBQ96477.1 sugar ABC transporter permease [Mesorhizobium sp. AA23]PBB40218.1 carbohydrate ABC transporter permease [Mesorhizobium sp. WSM3866]TIR58113.1 MAG: carbohydrate ABC transporter permease [Mesorhizobium sp.]